jgi:N-acetylmuramoyl-L-alanine amidase
MRTKFDVASGIAVAATLLTALLGSSGSEALAEEALPVIAPVEIAIGATIAPLASEVTQEAETVVPPQVEAPQAEANEPALSRAASLAEHVRAHKRQGPLDSELRCLAGAIYFEARGESLAGQLAVGRVVVERSKSGRFPASYCGVVFQRSQFSFVRGRSMPAIREDSLAWQRAAAIARIADQDSWHNPADGALFFHATHVAPRWRLKRLAQVDNHIFYR